MYTKVFYDGYLGRVNVIIGNVHPFMNKIRISRDNKELLYMPLIAKELTELHRPYEFDHDHHTHLFRKITDHEYCYHDESMQRYQTYDYKVEVMQENKDGTVERSAEITKKVKIE